MSNYFVYEGRLPSLNQYIDSCRKHPQAGAKLKRDAQEGVCWSIMFAVSKSTIRAIQKPCKIHFHYYEVSDRRDYDNVTGFAHKVLIDALVSMKILPNDNRRWLIGGTDDFHKSDKDYIKVEIEEIEE